MKLRRVSVQRTGPNEDGSYTYGLRYPTLENHRLMIQGPEPILVELDDNTKYEDQGREVHRSDVRRGMFVRIEATDSRLALRVSVLPDQPEPMDRNGTVQGRVDALVPPRRLREYLFRTQPKVTRWDLNRWDSDAYKEKRRKERELNEGKRENFVAKRIEMAASEYIERKEASQAPRTVEDAAATLSEFADYIQQTEGPKNVSGLLVKHIAQYRQWLLTGKDGTAKPQNPKTVNTKLQRLSAWLRWCIGESYCYHNAARQANLVPVPPPKAPRVTFQGGPAFWEMIGRLQGQPRATFGVLATSGLRINELRTLLWSDVHDDRIIVRRIEGESTKRHARILPVGTYLHGFLSDFREINSGGPLVAGVDGGTRPFSSQVNMWLKPFGVTPHDLRRWFRSALEGLPLGVGGDLIDDLLGHRASKVRRAYSNGLSPDANGGVSEDRLKLARKAIEAFDDWLAAGRPR